LSGARKSGTPDQVRGDEGVGRMKPINPVPYIAMLILVLGMIYLFYGR
jgi:hypothetical protein